MSFPPAVLEAVTQLGKSGGDIKPLPRVPDPPGAKGLVGQEPHAGYETKHFSDMKMWVST
jgi:hypothetical protein